MFTISRAADQVGITTATLRAWERRYSVVRPQRTDGAYRVYSDDDVRLLRSMKQLVDEGWSAGFAAQEALRTRGAAVAVPAGQDVRPLVLSEEFVAAAAAFDAERLDELLDQMFSLGRFETVANSYLFPALAELGAAWKDGRVTVAGEHLAAHAVTRRLSAAYDAAAVSNHGARVLIGLAPGNRHELGLLAFAVAARRAGLRTDYLGADVPEADWILASAEPSVRAIVMSVHEKADITSMAHVTAAVHRRHPDVVIAAGGAAQDQTPTGVLRLGDDFAHAAQMLAQEVAG